MRCLFIVLLAGCEFAGTGGGGMTEPDASTPAVDGSPVADASVDGPSLVPFAINTIVEVEDTPLIIDRASRTWTKTNDILALGDAYMSVENGTSCSSGGAKTCGPEMVFTFDVPSATELHFHLRAQPNGGGSDSAYYYFESEDTQVIDFDERFSIYQWETRNLGTRGPGIITLHIVMREPDVQLDALSISEFTTEPLF